MEWFAIKTLARMGGYRFLKLFAANHPRVLMYHRIFPESSADGGLTLEAFRFQLSILATHFNVQPLDKLIAQYQAGALKPHSVAITFDDGYKDFATYALPELKNFGLPATLFVTTRFIDGNTWLWPDILRWALGATKVDAWLAPNGKSYSLPQQWMQAWHAAGDHGLLLKEADKWDFIRDFCRDLSVEVPPAPTPPYAALSWNDLLDMPPELISIGSHTKNHPILTKLDSQQLYDEIQMSKLHIERQLKRPVLGFCYPNGMKSDVSAEVVDMVRASGYQFACLAYPGPEPLHDPFNINRYSIGGNQKEFFKAVYGFRYLRL